MAARQRPHLEDRFSLIAPRIGEVRESPRGGRQNRDIRVNFLRQRQRMIVTRGPDGQAASTISYASAAIASGCQVSDTGVKRHATGQPVVKSNFAVSGGMRCASS